MNLQLGTIKKRGTFAKLSEFVFGKTDLEISLPSVLLTQGLVGSGNEMYAIELARQAISQGSSIIFIDRDSGGKLALKLQALLNRSTESRLSKLEIVNTVDLQPESTLDAVVSGEKLGALYFGVKSMEAVDPNSRFEYLANLFNLITNGLKKRYSNGSSVKRTPLTFIVVDCLCALRCAEDRNNVNAKIMKKNLSLWVTQAIPVNTSFIFVEHDVESANKSAHEFLGGSLTCHVDLSGAAPVFTDGADVNTQPQKTLSIGEALVWRKHASKQIARINLPIPNFANAG